MEKCFKKRRMFEIEVFGLQKNMCLDLLNLKKVNVFSRLILLFSMSYSVFHTCE